MDEQERKLLQAKHRLEEAQARDRVRERKARTRRLIQKGAIVESALPETNSMTLEELSRYLRDLSEAKSDSANVSQTPDSAEQAAIEDALMGFIESF